MLVARVHPEILAAQNLPGEVLEERISGRSGIAPFADLEQHLHRNGTRIVKFFLHLSKEEQRRRFLRGSMSQPRTGSSARPTWPSGRQWDDYTRGLRGLPERHEQQDRAVVRGAGR